jgi:tetratricopeptide (TPR) repeat protein
MTLAKIDAIMEALRSERYRWTPVRRTYIEKKYSIKKRPLGIPTVSTYSGVAPDVFRFAGGHASIPPVEGPAAAWLGPRGRYQRALDSARQALAIAEEIDHPTWQAGAHLALGAIELDLLAYQTAIDHLQRTVALSTEGDQAIFREIGSGLLASALIGAGQPKTAMDVREAAGGTSIPMRSMGPRTLRVARAEHALATGDYNRALEIANVVRAVDLQAQLKGNVGPAGALFYGFSVLLCMTTSLASGGAGLGTLGLPESRLRALAGEAGFSHVKWVPIDNPFNTLYERRR